MVFSVVVLLERKEKGLKENRINFRKVLHVPRQNKIEISETQALLS